METLRRRTGPFLNLQNFSPILTLRSMLPCCERFYSKGHVERNHGRPLIYSRNQQVTAIRNLGPLVLQPQKNEKPDIAEKQVFP
jgi:hypothetical protein